MEAATHTHYAQRSRSSKHLTTIHGFAHSGDLLAFQKLLRYNPSLLNERNPVMAQTPLHVSAGNNRAEIVKSLLEWQGPEKVELEAKNMYGKLRYTWQQRMDAMKLHDYFLLTNGMTPLHLAVWYSIRSDDFSTVKTLLEYNADCSAKDNEGMTPMDHLSLGPGSEKLRQLLQRHIDEQRKKRALEACSETKAKMEELENALSNIVGLHELKIQLRKWAKGMLLDERRMALGLKVGVRRPPHMAFLGNPGTGKTMVARILGRLLHLVGILPTDRVTEVQRTDLVGEFVGHTGPKTRKRIKEAEGGILFVDEAYRLIPMQKADDKDYGLEALEEIMSVMDSGKVVVIFAGIDAIAQLIERETTGKQRREMNGGLADTMLVNARENLDLRLDFDCIDTDELRTITLEDLGAGLQLLSQ